MAQDYVVRQGDCLSSIAAAHGLPRRTVWDHANNAELRKRREHPDLLAPGDVVHIPDKTVEPAICATESRHRFRSKVDRVRIRLRLEDEGEPRKGVDYVLDVDGEEFRGTTDGEGALEHAVRASARTARLVTADDHYAIELGGLDPITQVSGVQQRLRNLGLDAGEADGVLSEKTRGALAAFQERKGLAPTGDVDDATRKALEASHGS